MSVLKNKRSESQLEFYHTATLIRKELTRFVMEEKIVPKRWRPVFTFPMVEKVIRLIDYITAGGGAPTGLPDPGHHYGRADFAAAPVYARYPLHQPGQIPADHGTAGERSRPPAGLAKSRP